ncbi:hypothetical protein GCM10022254_44750 [Actinomadura meridiana]|uniref:HTH lysR-type domain-containing protein n=1 Tax=Actinomadura meridiana TaxID=559626 RepID=A0ABP8C9G1_9ACTN
MTLNLRRLRYFIILSRELHFGRTSNLLGITPSALSQQIKALEEDVGIALIVRRGMKGVALTEAGRTLAEEAAQILDLCDDLVHRVRNIGAHEQFAAVGSPRDSWQHPHAM